MVRRGDPREPAGPRLSRAYEFLLLLLSLPGPGKMKHSCEIHWTIRFSYTEMYMDVRSCTIRFKPADDLDHKEPLPIGGDVVTTSEAKPKLEEHVL